jgi:hypothetical protein
VEVVSKGRAYAFTWKSYRLSPSKLVRSHKCRVSTMVWWRATAGKGGCTNFDSAIQVTRSRPSACSVVHKSISQTSCTIQRISRTTTSIHRLPHSLSIAQSFGWDKIPSDSLQGSQIGKGLIKRVSSLPITHFLYFNLVPIPLHSQPTTYNY